MDGRLMYKASADFVTILFILSLLLFMWMMPPFAGVGDNKTITVIRLILEFFIFSGVSIYIILKKGIKPFAFVIVVLALYFMNWVFSAGDIRHFISHFCQLALLFLLSEFFVVYRPLVILLRNIWIVTWVCFSSLAILTVLGKYTGLIHFSYVADEYMQPYFYNPFFGFFMMKDMGHGWEVPRYVGFLTEPIIYAFFAGFNMVIADKLIQDKRKKKYFFIINMLAGMLTFSYSFYIFLVIFFLFWGYIKRIPSLYVFVGGILTIWVIIFVGSHISLPYSSMGVRVGRYLQFIEYIGTHGIDKFLFGVGVDTYVRDTGGAGASAWINTLSGRGLFLFLIWTYLLNSRSKYIPGLFAFILYYGFFLDFYVYPLFVVGLAIASSYSQIKLPIFQRDDRSQAELQNSVLSN